MATSPKVGPDDRPDYPLQRFIKQLPDHGKLLGSDLRAEGLPLGDGRQIANQARITQLAFAGGQLLVAPVAYVGKATI